VLNSENGDTAKSGYFVISTLFKNERCGRHFIFMRGSSFDNGWEYML